MKIESKFDVGDMVWVGYVEENDKSPFCKFFGPVRVCKVVISSTQSIGGQISQSVVYSIPQLGEGVYPDHCLFSTSAAAWESISSKIRNKNEI